MINDILEQTAEDYFRHLGYFTQHNVKYKPNKKGPAYAVHSDIDIIGINPTKRGIERVVVVSCKSWHGGIRIKGSLDAIKRSLRRTRKIYREVAQPYWSKALKDKVYELTDQKTFVFYFCCTRYDKRHRELWEGDKEFRKNLAGCKIKLLDFEEMATAIWPEMHIITPSNSELGRLFQFIHFSGGKLHYKDLIKK